MSAAAIGRRVGARLLGHNWSLACPVCQDYELLLADAEDGRLLTFCRGGCDHYEICAALVEYGMLDGGAGGFGNDHIAPVARSRPQVPDEQRIEGAHRIYDPLGPGGVVVSTYFKSRHIALPVPSILRFGMCPHRTGGVYPAMAAPVVGVDGAMTAVHLTFLRSDGSAKADFADKSLQRETRGVVRGGMIRLMSFDHRRALGVAEGLETSLAAAQLFGIPTWSAVHAGGLKSISLPEEVRNVVIFADHDDSGVGRRNAEEAYRKLVSEGREARIAMPPSPVTSTTY